MVGTYLLLLIARNLLEPHHLSPMTPDLVEWQEVSCKSLKEEPLVAQPHLLQEVHLMVVEVVTDSSHHLDELGRFLSNHYKVPPPSCQSATPTFSKCSLTLSASFCRSIGGDEATPTGLCFGRMLDFRLQWRLALGLFLVPVGMVMARNWKDSCGMGMISL